MIEVISGAPTLRVRGSEHAIDRMWTMGVVNANPDSFSDAGTSTTREMLVTKCDDLVLAGADIVDIGGQSAITGRDPVSVEQEIDRVVPLVEHVARQHPGVLVSVDTYKPPVADAALRAGASIINDVSGLADERLADLCLEHQAALVVMHTAAAPLVRLQDRTLYGEVAREVAAFIEDRIEVACARGLPREAVIVDPGPDFTKTPEQTLSLLRNVHELRALDRPVLLALSRKDFLGAITGRPPRQREAATHAALAFFAATSGFLARVHDVAAARDVIATVEALAGLRELDPDYLLPDGIRHEPS